MSIGVIGVGNILFNDEGVGVYAAAYLEANYTFEPSIEIIDGGTLGFGLVAYLQQMEQLIIIDTLSINEDAGSIFVIPADELMELGEIKQTAHEVEILQMMQIASVTGKMAQTHIVGIVPDDMQSVRLGLSTKVLERFEALVAEVLKELQRIGITAEKNREHTALDNIMHSVIRLK